MSDLFPQAGEESIDDREMSSAELRADFASFWSAPLPRPEILSQYNDAFPGCAERIVKMAEDQSHHRQALEAAVVHGDVYSQRTGLWLGFILALIVISCGAWLVYSGRIEWGAGFITVPLIALVSVFVIGKQDQRKQLEADHALGPEKKLPFSS